MAKFVVTEYSLMASEINANFEKVKKHYQLIVIHKNMKL